MSANTKRNHILNVAESAFKELGFEKATIRYITTSAGVNTALLNYYFGSKENLFNEIMIRKINQLDLLEIKSMTSKSPLEQLIRIADHLILIISNNKSFFTLMLEELLKNNNALVVNRISKFFHTIEALISDIINEGMDLGKFRSVDSTFYAKTLIGMLMYELVLGKSSFITLKNKSGLVSNFISIGLVLSDFTDFKP